MLPLFLLISEKRNKMDMPSQAVKREMDNRIESNLIGH